MNCFEFNGKSIDDIAHHYSKYGYLNLEKLNHNKKVMNCRKPRGYLLLKNTLLTSLQYKIKDQVKEVIKISNEANRPKPTTADNEIVMEDYFDKRFIIKVETEEDRAKNLKQLASERFPDFGDQRSWEIVLDEDIVDDISVEDALKGKYNDVKPLIIVWL